MDTISSRQKALSINLDNKIFGTIAEIGAGQEVARRFFKAGGSSGTVAKTISAYDMSFSNALYGETNSKRYVSEERLKTMLDVEYSQLLDSVQKDRPVDTRYFAFANTVSAINFQKTNESHGWIGIKFQLKPGCEANEIIMHVKMYEKDNFLQQRSLGILGVNFIYAAYHYHNYPNTFLRSLLDTLSEDQIEIDMIRMSGPQLDYVDNRLLSVQLVKNKITNVTVFDKDHNVRPPSDIFYKKNIMVLRGSFRPITEVTLDMLENGLKDFKKDYEVSDENTMLFCEISMDNLLQKGNFDEKDFLDRVDLINGLGIHVIISDLQQHYEFVSYFDIFKIYHLGIIIGAATYKDLFEEEYYTDLSGGILEGFSKLFKNSVKMYVYPALADDSKELISSDSFKLDPQKQPIHDFLKNNNKVVDIQNYNTENMHIYSKDVLQSIKQGNNAWEKMVPEKVKDLIKENRMFSLK